MSAVSVAKELTHLPVITDPSHGTGIVSLLEPMCLSSVMAGCDGFMLEVHGNPEEALCDGDQALTPEGYADLMEKTNSLWNFRRGL